jgi:hypothetical protein
VAILQTDMFSKEFNRQNRLKVKKSYHFGFWSLSSRKPQELGHLVDTNAGRKFLKKSTEKITNKIGLNLDVGPIVTP